MGIAAHIRSIFGKYPDKDKGLFMWDWVSTALVIRSLPSSFRSTAPAIRAPARRTPGSRKLSRSLGHWNPEIWTGDTSTANVDLGKCWRDGACRAATILRKHGLFSHAQVDWVAIAADEGKPTMLRPKGGQVGVRGA